MDEKNIIYTWKECTYTVNLIDVQYNKAAYEIYEECSKRGFYIRVYASTLKDGHVNIFLNNNIEVAGMEKLNEDIIDDFDYIYAAFPICGNPLFRTVRKYIFIVPSTYFDEFYFENDFAFTVRDVTKPLIEREEWPIEKFNVCIMGLNPSP